MHEEFVKFVNLHGLSGHAYTMALWAFETGHAAGMERAAEICEAQGRMAESIDGNSFYIALGQAANAIRAEIKEQS